MKRYTAAPPRPRADSDSDYRWMQFDEPTRDSITVIERERHPTFSGLYDAEGRELYSHEPARPIGFATNWEE